MLILLGLDVIAEMLVQDLLVCLEEEGKEILGDLASCCQGVNQVLDIGIGLSDVVANGNDVGVRELSFSWMWRTMEQVSMWLSWMMTLRSAVPHGRLAMVYFSLQIMTFALTSLVREFMRQW